MAQSQSCRSFSFMVWIKQDFCRVVMLQRNHPSFQITDRTVIDLIARWQTDKLSIIGLIRRGRGTFFCSARAWCRSLKIYCNHRILLLEQILRHLRRASPNYGVKIFRFKLIVRCIKLKICSRLSSTILNMSVPNQLKIRRRKNF